ncbi:PepSY domain-containing protein [Streptococcus salivarius]|uniref:PepSY domain-containing protein n=1 Tax=Streptococcus salivarius TaxID=1304 RepID=UPI0015D1BD31|nr:PepSY domain-containing protein [Streptococcus salivarius]
MKKTIKQKTIKQKTVITLASLGLACSSVVVFANTAKATKSTGSTTQSSLTVDQAKEKALNESKSGQVIGYEQEAKFGKTVFEITILDGQNEKEYKIDGQTGDVLKSKTKDLTKDKDDKQLINASYKIDLAGAESQVKSKYPKSTIEKLQLDVENNTLVYDVSLTEGKKEIDLELDANTGQIVEEDIETEKD